MLLFHIASYAPSHVVYFVASLVLFDIRKKGLFALVYALSFAISLPMSHIESSVLRMLVGFFLMVGPQLLMASDRPLRKAFLSAVFLAVMMLSEILPTLLWFQITDFDPASVQAYLHFLNEVIILRTLHVLVIVAMFAGVFVADRRIGKVRTDQGIVVCAGFLVAQCALLCLVVIGSETLGHISSDLARLLLFAFVFCLLADTALFVCMFDFNRTALEVQRAEVLRREVDRCLERYQEIKTLVVQVAHLRHDLANQTNTALMLMRQGDLIRAWSCLEDLATLARQGECKGDDLPELGRHVQEIESSGADARESAALKADFLKSDAVRLEAVPPGGERLWLSVARVLFVSSQILLLLVLLTFIALYGVTLQFALSVIGAVVLCVASDLVLMRALRYASRQKLASEKSRLLEEQGVAWALQNERMAAELEQASRIRAEMLDEIELLKGMLDRGEGAKALLELEGAVRLKPPRLPVYCEHEVANVVIALKAHACEGREIDFSHAVDIPSDVGISDTELCAVLSNMLDNAINGCLEVEGPRRVSLKAGFTAGVLVVAAENTWSGGEFLRRDRRPSLIRKHGWGLDILEELARRHGGSFEAAPAEGGIFRVSIMLPVSRACAR